MILQINSDGTAALFSNHGQELITDRWIKAVAWARRNGQKIARINDYRK